MSDDSVPASTRARRDPLAWPTSVAAFAAGLTVSFGDGWSGGLALAMLVLGAATWQTDNVLSSRWPRARRPQWAARGLLASAVALSCALGPVSAAASAFLAGGSASMVSRDRRPLRTSTLPIAGSVGLIVGLTASSLLDVRARLALSLVALLGGAMTCLGATFRGGPGRIPVRPIDVAWIYVLGALLAAALALPR